MEKITKIYLIFYLSLVNHIDSLLLCRCGLCITVNRETLLSPFQMGISETDK